MFDGRDPIYLQIADQIRDDVVSGALAEEEQVMSTTQYATTYRINPATAAKAFTQLVDDGVVYKRRGVGIFVAPGARARLARPGRVLRPSAGLLRRVALLWFIGDVMNH